MADRVTSYVFRGDFKNLAAGLTAMGKGVGDLGVKLTALDAQGVKSRRGLTAIGSTAGKFGLVAAAGFGAAVLAAANFDQAMSSVQAATHETAANMELLRAAALKAGADTKFSATEAAAGVEALAKAGVSTTDILAGGLTGALDLAAAGNLEVGQAAEIAATAMTQFNLAGSDVPHVADLLAAGAGKAQGEVTDLAQALNQSGLVAAQMGLSIEETTGTLSAFASAGLLGSDAGTSLKTMLLRLANPSQKASEVMESLGINAYDANGNLVTMSALADQLQGAFQGQTQATRDAALATIFGSDAIRAANVLYKEGGSGITDWKNKVDDSGFAAETAAIKMDNLKGDLEQLKGSLETALIGSGSGAQGPFRGLVQGATDAVNAFNDLSPAAQGTASTLLAVTAVTGGGLWFGSKVIQGISDTREALQNLNIDAGKARGALTLLKGSLALGAAIVALGEVDSLLDSISDHDFSDADLPRQLEAFADGRIAGNLGLIGSKLAAIQASQTTGGVDKLFGWIPGVSSDAEEAATNIDKIDQALAGMVEAGQADQAAVIFAKIQAQADGAGVSAQTLAKSFDAFQVALDNAGLGGAKLGGILPGVIGALQGFAGAENRSSGAIQGETRSLQDNIKAMRDKRAASLSAFDAETQWREALKSATAQAKRNEAGIRGNSHAALENRGQLSALAAAWNGQSAAVKNNNARFREARKAFIDTAAAMGVPREQARLLAKQLLEIPKSREVKVTADTAGARAELQRIDEIRLGDKIIHVRTSKDFGSGPGSATGGYISGPGTSTSDSIPAMLSDGEYVVRASAVAKYGREFMSAINSGRYADGGYVDRRYAGGGMVQAPSSTTRIIERERIVERMPDRIRLQVDGREFTAYVSGVSRSEIDGEARHQKIQDRT